VQRNPLVRLRICRGHIPGRAKRGPALRAGCCGRDGFATATPSPDQRDGRCLDIGAGPAFRRRPISKQQEIQTQKSKSQPQGWPQKQLQVPARRA